MARANAEALALFCMDGAGFVETVVDAATYHDLGKLDPANQDGLRAGRHGVLPWDHIDAGVAHLMREGAEGAAWLVRAHHSPGLPCWAEHFVADGRRLRGRRSGTDYEPHDIQTARTDRLLADYLAIHETCLGQQHAPSLRPARHGLATRLKLSCLVDADHTDTAGFDTGRGPPPEAPPPRWRERLEALDWYVAALPSSGNPERDRNRADFYAACRTATLDAPFVACKGPVGLGKTTAVTAFLLRAADAHRLRRLFIVAPYTNVISQAVKRLRDAVTLPGEDPEEVVAEHHHRADFQSVDTRDLAVTWRAPIVVTTAVQFFETLAANAPSRLRKLHALPGSAVFLDEAHAALPTPLWQQNWRWLRELAGHWSCRFVLASGSLARFWEKEAVVAEGKCELPELMPSPLAQRVLRAETRRISYATLGRLADVDKLTDAVLAAPGPHLVILNTVQSAAVVARALAKEAGDRNVMHVSTALCPRDRSAVIAKIATRLGEPDRDWMLVATSCVEAGVDFSFRTAFRERFSAASLIQIGGRVNRHGECEHGGCVFDFVIDSGNGLVLHPAATAPAGVLGRLFKEGAFAADQIDPADLVTRAMDRELREKVQAQGDPLTKAERDRDYPSVAALGRVIDVDTRLVVVDPQLKQALEHRAHLPFRTLLNGSVQLWANKIDALGLSPVHRGHDIFWFPYRYDPGFLGYMAGVLELEDFAERGFAIYD
ncbi:DEAD/DEAH box helicase [Methylobacterium nodulans]|nr:DEAD/DEAH box helicase [Methylobacterium nodulans]